MSAKKSVALNGAEALVHTLIDGGVSVCFANPGTSEMHFVAALDRIPGMTCVLGLFEGVLSGAADGYARMADKPAAVLLHCGPGLGNGIANLHNARRAFSPVVNIVGDQATYHNPLDPPLSTDVESLARPVSRSVRTSVTSADVGRDAAQVIAASQSAEGGVATLILPSDVCWDLGGVVGAPMQAEGKVNVNDSIIETVAELLTNGSPTLLYAGGAALREQGLELLERIISRTGAGVMAPVASGRIARGRGRLSVPRMPYFVEPAVVALSSYRNIVLVGATDPVAFFAYPGKPQTPVANDAKTLSLAGPSEDVLDALARLAERLGCAEIDRSSVPLPFAAAAVGAVSAEALGQSLAAMLPEQAIVVDEGITLGGPSFQLTDNAAPHDWLQLTGGAIGSGIPMSIGAAVAARDRRVVTLQADGSAAYTIQGLWTQAREKLDITTIILSNRRYAILLLELDNVGAEAGSTARDMLELENPPLDWVSLAKGFGMRAARAETMEEFNQLFEASLAHPGPFLIELEFA